MAARTGGQRLRKTDAVGNGVTALQHRGVAAAAGQHLQLAQVLLRIAPFNRTDIRTAAQRHGHLLAVGRRRDAIGRVIDRRHAAGHANGHALRKITVAGAEGECWRRNVERAENKLIAIGCSAAVDGHCLIIVNRARLQIADRGGHWLGSREVGGQIDQRGRAPVIGGCSILEINRGRGVFGVHAGV